MSSYGSTQILTPRLLLRAMHTGDVDALHAMYADPEMMRYMGGGTFSGTAEQLRVRIAERIAEYERLGIGLYITELRASGEIVGRCGFLRWEIEGRDEVEVGYIIKRTAWGNGYATEAAGALIERAFGELGIARIVSLIHVENIASQRVALHNGLRHERDVEIPEIPFSPIRLYSIERAFSATGPGV